MIEKNTICHYLNLDGIRLTLADITDAALEAAKRHNMSDQAAAMLGEDGFHSLMDSLAAIQKP